MLVQGLHCKKVTIKPDEDSLGSCISPTVLGYEFRDDREKRMIARECILAIYAGMPAQRLIQPDCAGQ